MTRIIVLFNLKQGVDQNAYESWARQNDLPVVNALSSVDKFEVLRSCGLLGGGDAPYQYIEVLDVKDMSTLGQEIATAKMQSIAAEFRQFADNPLFILTESLSEAQ